MDRKYVCDICNEFFDNKTLLKNHFQKHNLRCDICNRQCLNLSGLRNHKRRHNAEPTFIGVYRFLCEYCGKKFMRIEPFRTHKRTHFNEFPFECDVCKKKFAAAGYLILHKRRHVGDKRYECDICKKKFLQANKVDVHKRKHTNERPYACDICGRRFHQKSSVKIHMRVHTGERPVSTKHNLLKLKTNELDSNELIVEKENYCNALTAEKTNGGNTKYSEEKLKSEHNLVKLKTDELNFNELIVKKTIGIHKTYSRNISLKKHLNNNPVKTNETFNEVTVEKSNGVDNFCNDLPMQDENCRLEIINANLEINGESIRQDKKKEAVGVDLFDVNVKQDEMYCLNKVSSYNFSEQDSVSYCDPIYENNFENCNVDNVLETEDKHSNEDYLADLKDNEKYKIHENYKNKKYNQIAENELNSVGKQNILNCTDKNKSHQNEKQISQDLTAVEKKNVNRVLFCDICQSTFTKLSLFVAHRKQHSKEKMFKCAICNLECHNLSGLTNHKRTHSEDRTYIGVYRYLCDICGKRFMRIGPFKTHKLNHTGELPFECDICNKKFVASDYLAVHKRRHAGDKRYECDVCHKKFFNTSKVVIHKRKHTGERPYPCEICSKRFFLRSSVVIHKRVHFKD